MMMGLLKLTVAEDYFLPALICYSLVAKQINRTDRNENQPEGY